MGLFSTRNNDGASGLGEPVNTVPRRVDEGMDRVAEAYSCHSRAELYSSPTLKSNSFDPARASEN